MTTRLAQEPELAANYVQAHERFLAKRNEIEDLGTDFSGGGMPDRVKCLHVLMAYALAEGPGVVWLGDESVALACEAGRSEGGRGGKGCGSTCWSRWSSVH